MKSRLVSPCLLLMLLLGFARVPADALQFFDDFSTGSQNWSSDANWSVTNSASGAYFYRCDASTDSHAWRMYMPLNSSWLLQADIHFRTLYGNAGTTGAGSLALSQPNYFTTLLGELRRSSSGQIVVSVAYYDTSWHQALISASLPGSPLGYHLSFSRLPGINSLQITVQATNGFFYRAITPPIPASVLDSVCTPGFRAIDAVVDFANLQVNTPLTNQNQHYLILATNAASDLLDHWWIGDTQTGQIVNTWNGYTNHLSDSRGGLWERAMFYFVLNDLWRITDDATLRQRLTADWNRTKSVYTTNQLQSCGQDSGVNWAVDDAGWSSIMYLDAYQASGDATALLSAKGLVNNAFNRWLDNQLGGGLWYSDAKQVKSLYQVAIVLSALQIYRLTGDQSFYDRAMQCYTWMETYLLRSDDLYWCDYESSGPVGQDRPNDIHEAGSLVFLGGNMGMALLHARLYQLTTNQSYLNRAVRTVNATFNSLLVTRYGVYVNDRDAWTEGTFAGDWAREVLILPGIDPKHWTMLWTTADSIYTNARTNGYFGGSWSGPAEGSGSAWWVVGSTPEQITTSASSANMIVAAAVLEAQYANVINPRLQISLHTDASITVTNFGQPYWPYQFQSSSNLTKRASRSILTTWNTVTNFYCDPASGVFNFKPPTNGLQLFFRAFPSVHPF